MSPAILDVLVQNRRNRKAAKRVFRKLLKGLCYVSRVIVTDKPGSYGTAKSEIPPYVEHRQSRYLNHRLEVSHEPARWRERHRRRFKSARHARQFLATHTPIHNHFHLRRHRPAPGNALLGWYELAHTGVPTAALPLHCRVDRTIGQRLD
ncbi:transposase [Microvirga makkahensis]|uniref:transposase n=1 Tax=Microvirga makkahensis TaxID=1128670 RepID=UPI001FE694D5|nr:transposase [Microvirga makkahensis]